MSDRLTKFFASYGSYHNNIINKLIHIVFIPIILTTFQGMLFKSPYPFLAKYLTGALSCAYVYVDWFSGLISTCMYFGTLNFITTQPVEMKTLVYFNLAAWIAQFIGHGIFEKRAPALVDNILLTLVAPHFVTLEILFELGYKKAQYKAAQKLINEDIKKFRESK